MEQEDIPEDGARFYTTSQLADLRHDGQEAEAGGGDHHRVGQEHCVWTA